MRRIQAIALRSLLLLLAGALLLPLSQAQGQTKKVGVQWSDGTLQQVLDEAKAKDKMVMLDFWAGHCAQCGVMTTELWDTEDGAKLADGLISLQLDTTNPAGRDGMSRFPITGLPCVLFLRSDGTEIDRVEGYMSKQEFLMKAQPIKEGMDPLPGMEALLKEQKGASQLMVDVMERYMWRKRTVEVDTLFARIMRADPRNERGLAEKAILKMGRYLENVLHDEERTIALWKMMAEKYPTCMSIGAAIDGAWTAWATMGRYQDWLDWVCPLVEKNPGQQMMLRAVVAIGYRGGYQSPCLAKAARIVGPTVTTRKAWYDSAAVYFEGKGPKPQ
jgi:hypothetical protein